jgi:hypothetical protein
MTNADALREALDHVPADVYAALTPAGFIPTADAGNLWFYDRGEIRLLFAEDGSDYPSSLAQRVTACRGRDDMEGHRIRYAVRGLARLRDRCRRDYAMTDRAAMRLGWSVPALVGGIMLWQTGPILLWFCVVAFLTSVGFLSGPAQPPRWRECEHCASRIRARARVCRNCSSASDLLLSDKISG